LDIERLKRETAADHDAVEGAVPLMAEDLDRATYVLCLQRIHGVVSAWEENSAKGSPEWLGTLVIARQRKGMLERDLAWFGSTVDGEQRPTLPEMNTQARRLGVMYVMEGSTLGGQLIARHVERVLGLSEGQGNAYFRGHGARTGTMWKEFCEVLQTRVPDSEAEAVMGAAKEMFAVFGSWMGRRAR
jgi:heme oxygenase